MAELQFGRIEITDKNEADRLLAQSNFRGCEYTFGNSFVWRNFYNLEVAFTRGMMFRKYETGGETVFSYPAGNGSMDEAIALLKEYCSENGTRLVISAEKDTTEQIVKKYPDVRVQLNRDACDYVYLSEDLAELKGKKYHAKRNHLNRFYENNWSYEPLTAQNMDECIAMNEVWCKENVNECDVVDSEEEKSKHEEMCIVRCSFKHFDELGYIGGVLRVDGAVQAFTFGEPSSDDCFVVHVEKALRNYQGTYTAINREFVKSLGGRYKYINREDDTGAENLRKAKLSYHPAFLEEKYIITFGGTNT
jgi:hypothetical protein